MKGKQSRVNSKKAKDVDTTTRFTQTRTSRRDKECQTFLSGAILDALLTKTSEATTSCGDHGSLSSGKNDKSTVMAKRQKERLRKRRRQSSRECEDVSISSGLEDVCNTINELMQTLL